MVWVRSWMIWRNVSLEMVRAGYAVVYRDANAVYGTIEHRLLEAEMMAK
jgi:endonuclease YncB( thermonuclease family)